jgi:large subunit ribosomal protein L19
MHPLVQSLAKSQEKHWPKFRVGDQVRVWVKIADVGGERTQAFEGIVMRIKGGSPSGTFTVRKISFGIGVERTFPFNSLHIDKIEVLKSTKVRRAKLYYLRKLSGKAARPEEKDIYGASRGEAEKASHVPVTEKGPASEKPKAAAAPGRAHQI